ncbi:Zinc finger BED domain-containing protein RICESLEEPER 2 [Bienertia sinuspersici]
MLDIPKTEEEVKPTTERKRQRKLTSEVWADFEFIKPQKNGELRCKCKRCGKDFNAESKSGTGNLKRHLDRCKKRCYRDVGQMLLESGSGGSLANRAPDFNPNVFRELLTMAVVKHELPFQFVEYEGIRKCFNYLNPDLNIVSRNTIKADLIKKFKNEKMRVKEVLSVAPGRIAFTSDCWSSITTDGYMSFTAHFIDSEWRLQKLILNFSFLPPPHTGLAMSNHICSLLKEWGIQKKVFSITLDNASSNDCMADFLKSEIDLVCEGAYFHVRCCAHIMNLIVQDGLKEIDEAIYKVRESVKYCKGSQSRKQKFFNSVAHVELQSSRGLRQDVPTRWNSTYLMLESVLYTKRHLFICKELMQTMSIVLQLRSGVELKKFSSF